MFLIIIFQHHQSFNNFFFNTIWSILMFANFKKSIGVLTLILIIFLSACNSLNKENQGVNTSNSDIIESVVPIISATGKVVPENWATISSPAPGNVLELLVSENQVVVEGQKLLILSGSEQISAIIKTAELELILAEQAFEDFIENAPLISAQAFLTLSIAENTLTAAETALNDLLAGVKQSNIDLVEANLIILKDQLESARDNLEEYNDNPKDDLVQAGLQSILAQAELDYDNALILFDEISSPASAEDIVKAEANVALALTMLNQAQSDYEIVKNGSDPQIIETFEGRIENIKAQILVAQKALDDLTITAPFSGTISQVYVQQSEWVNPSQPLLIIGDLTSLQIETTDLNEIDVTQVKIGQICIIKFDALVGVEVIGWVNNISSKSTPGIGVNYKVTLGLTEIPEGLLWDMTAFIDIPLD